MTELQEKCHRLLNAYNSGDLGDTTFPEEQHPIFLNNEDRLMYFTLPMALNYRRSSSQLWKAATATFNDPDTYKVYVISEIVKMSEIELTRLLLKHKLALLPRANTKIWITIARTVSKNWGLLSNLFCTVNTDFSILREIVTRIYKPDFPYLSGPKIFNYWNLVLMKYCNITYTDKHIIDVAPDVHVRKSSVRIGLITNRESQHLSTMVLSELWRKVLKGTVICPIDMHPPLWFWSKNGFKFSLI